MSQLQPTCDITYELKLHLNMVTTFTGVYIQTENHRGSGVSLRYTTDLQHYVSIQHETVHTL